MPTDYHAEHVGSPLRPPWLLEARSGHNERRKLELVAATARKIWG